jgi:GNAT superfamily N-acetyltransferase
MHVESVRENPRITQDAIKYIQSKWANPNSLKVYEDCISNCINSNNGLPQWYLLMDQDKIIGCAGLITNDFISRMDLFPWLCALYIDNKYRGNNYAKLLIDKAIIDSKLAGYSNLYLCTDHIGYYEKFGFTYLAQGYHPWGEESRIYKKVLNSV